MSTSETKNGAKPISGPGASARVYQRVIPVLNKVFLPLFKIWVAGEHIGDAIRETEKLTARHSNGETIINYLGEHYTQEWKVQRTFEEYMRALSKISEAKVKATVSIKPSQMGFDLPAGGNETARRNMTSIVAKAESLEIFVWIDMEHTAYTDFTLDTYRDWLKEFGNVGIVIQANLKRTMDDLRSLVAQDRSTYVYPAKIRICKGIYKEPDSVAFTKKPDINENFGALIHELVFNSPKDVWVAVASHDDVYVNQGIRENGENPHEFFQVQMLRGVRPEFQKELISRGINLAIYTPYGEDSLPYSFRRATEANNLTATVIKSLLSGIYKRAYGK